MKAFLDKIVKGDKDVGKKPKQENKNPFAAFGGGPRSFSGQGQSLGGSQPGRTISIRLENPGPLGMKIEKRPNSESSSIVAMVVPGGQAEQAGLQRGDVLYWHGQDEEISYNQFIEMAGSEMRPLLFDVRRIKTKAPPSSSPATETSAEAFQRKQAMIAAAEAREKAAKQWIKPIPKKAKEATVSQVINEFRDEPMSEEAKKAILAAKSGETELAKQLGYNPYETNKSTAGQARNATVAVIHGAIGGNANPLANIPKVASPKELSAADTAIDPVSVAFEDAFTILVSTNLPSAVVTSFGVMRKLIVNATTKGQASIEEGAKFRRVRLSNDKIKAAITDVHGALDLMMSVGFQLTEEDGESFLVYPAAEPSPTWLTMGLTQMEHYEQNTIA